MSKPLQAVNIVDACFETNETKVVTEKQLPEHDDFGPLCY